MDLQDEMTLTDRLDRMSASMLAHRLLTDALVHVLCLGSGGLSRASLLHVLDVVHAEMGDNLGFDDMLVDAFREHRDGLRQLLLDEAIKDLGRSGS
jgi:hypothetical protein